MPTHTRSLLKSSAIVYNTGVWQAVLHLHAQVVRLQVQVSPSKLVQVDCTLEDSMAVQTGRPTSVMCQNSILMQAST